jgi:uncharacterized protein (DUF2147 family)
MRSNHSGKLPTDITPCSCVRRKREPSTRPRRYRSRRCRARVWDRSKRNTCPVTRRCHAVERRCTVELDKRLAARHTRAALYALATVIDCRVRDGSAAAAAATDVTGIWLTEGSEALIRIAPCGGDSICGTITWLREPNDPATGMPKADTKNPDPSRRSQPIVGVRIFYDMKPSGADQWSGKVYSTKDGAVVDGKLSAKSDNEIRIQGCFLAFCGGQNWTRQRAPAHHGKS